MELDTTITLWERDCLIYLIKFVMEELSEEERAFLTYLVFYMERGKYSHAMHEILDPLKSVKPGITETDLHNVKKSLEEKGLIVYLSYPGKPNEYLITFEEVVKGIEKPQKVQMNEGEE